MINFGQKHWFGSILAKNPGFDRFWPNKLVLVDFHAVWCAPCKAMSPVIDKVSADFKGKAKVEKVDVEVNKEITTAYQVESVPGFVIFKDGKKVWSHKGTISYNDLSGVLKKYM